MRSLIVSEWDVWRVSTSAHRWPDKNRRGLNREGEASSTVKKNCLNKKVTERRSGSQTEAWRLFSFCFASCHPSLEAELPFKDRCTFMPPVLCGAGSLHPWHPAQRSPIDPACYKYPGCNHVSLSPRDHHSPSAWVTLRTSGFDKNSKTAFIAFVCFPLAINNAELFSNVHYSVLILKWILWVFFFLHFCQFAFQFSCFLGKLKL